MSYILDALKKAERERGIRQVPSLITVRDLRGMQRNRLAAIAGGLLVCAAAVFLFFLPTLSKILWPPKPSPVGAEQNRVASRPEVEHIAEPTSVNAGSTPLALSEPPVPPKAGSSHDTPALGPSGVRSDPGSTAAPPSAAEIFPREANARNPPLGTRRTSQSTKGEAPSQRSTPEPVGLPPAEKAPPHPISDTDNPAAKEVLPAAGATQTTPMSLQEAMAKMTLNILVYEEAESERKVVINGRQYVKGDYVEGHYLIESITLEGAVLSYKGVQAVLRPR